MRSRKDPVTYARGTILRSFLEYESQKGTHESNDPNGKGKNDKGDGNRHEGDGIHREGRKGDDGKKGKKRRIVRDQPFNSKGPYVFKDRSLPTLPEELRDEFYCFTRRLSKILPSNLINEKPSISKLRRLRRIRLELRHALEQY